MLLFPHDSGLKEMLVPGIMAVAAPVLVGVLLGTAALGGLQAGALTTGVMMAIFMANSGGAWDNCEKIHRRRQPRRKRKRSPQGVGCRRYRRRSLQGYFRTVHQHPDQTDDHRVTGIRTALPFRRRNLIIEDGQKAHTEVCAFFICNWGRGISENPPSPN